MIITNSTIAYVVGLADHQVTSYRMDSRPFKPTHSTINMKSTLLGLGLILALWQVGNAAIFSLSATDLAPFDPLGGLADAYVRVYYAYGVSDNYNEIGQTAVVDNSAEPVWYEKYNITFVPGLSQRLRFHIWDEDLDGDDFMGDVEFFLAELETSGEGVLTKPFSLPQNGNLKIRKA